MRPNVTIYTDGACSGNPGPGGWGAVLIYNGVEKELSGGEPDTTNNRMELLAVISALEALKKPCNVNLFTDSKYVMDGATKYMPTWLKKNWKTAGNKPVKNQELWERLNTALTSHTVNWNWVKGHAGNALNERVDALAVAAIVRP